MRRHIVKCLTTLYFLIIFSFSSSHVLTAVKALSCLFYKTSQVLALQKNLKVQSAWLDGVVINAGQGRVWVGRPANACKSTQYTRVEYSEHHSAILRLSCQSDKGNAQATPALLSAKNPPSPALSLLRLIPINIRVTVMSEQRQTDSPMSPMIWQWEYYSSIDLNF